MQFGLLHFQQVLDYDVSDSADDKSTSGAYNIDDRHM